MLVGVGGDSIVTPLVYATILLCIQQLVWDFYAWILNVRDTLDPKAIAVGDLNEYTIGL